jgi:S1 RNA binding domain protein
MSAVEVGSKLEGKVTGITNFGAFVELPDGVTGLVHISEIANQYVKDVHDFLKVNDIVTVKVINVEENGKIGLSIKQAQEQEAKPKFSRRKDNFEDKISKFLRESEDRLMSLKRQMDKRGGRSSKRG